MLGPHPYKQYDLIKKYPTHEQYHPKNLKQSCRLSLHRLRQHTFMAPAYRKFLPSVSHTRTVLSQEPETILPSFVTQTELTRFSWPLHTASLLPCISHTRTVSSTEPETILPSFVTQTEITHLHGPCIPQAGCPAYPTHAQFYPKNLKQSCRLSLHRLK